MANSKIQRIKRVLPGMASRRLAAILFTDIVGYTALMQQDEKMAITRLNHFKQTLNKRVAEFSGEIIQYYGDGCLLLFASSLDAVGFAKCIQEDFRQEPSIPARIGIHAGDVVLKEGFVYGDNVNVTSRIESLGAPGSILLSQTVRNQIKNQTDFNLSSLGFFHFKNVEEPMELFALANEGFPIPVPEDMEGKLKTNGGKDIGNAPERKYKTKLGSLSVLLLMLAAGWYFFVRPSDDELLKSKWENSIVILPFHNLNNNEQQEYLSIGVADEIRAQLATIPKLKVISRSSSMFYYDKQLPIQQIGEELKAAYILEGTVQQIGEELKISVQLSNSETDQVEWAPVYERNIQDIFTIQEEIALEIANKLELDLSEREKRALKNQHTLSASTYDLYLRAVSNASMMTSEGLKTGEKLLEDVVDVAEDYPLAYINLAWLMFYKVQEKKSGSADSTRQMADYYISQAKRIDPEMPQLHSIQGAIYFYYNWDIEAAENEARKAVASGDLEGHSLLFDILIRTLRYDEAIQVLNRAIEIDPLSIVWVRKYGQVSLAKREFDKAAMFYKKSIGLDSLDKQGHYGLIKMYNQMGRYHDAVTVYEENDFLQVNPSPSEISQQVITYYLAREKEKATLLLEKMETLWEHQSQAGLAFSIGTAYAGILMKDKSLEWIRKSFESHESEMMDLLLEPSFEILQDDPAYKEILKATGLDSYCRPR